MWVKSGSWTGRLSGGPGGDQDYDLWLRISEYAPLANLPECLISYRRHFASVSATAAHKQLLIARLARLSAADRRAARPDFVDELNAPINLDTLRVHDKLRTTVEFYGTLARPSKNLVSVRDLNRLGCTDLNHAERKAAQYWLVSCSKLKQVGLFARGRYAGCYLFIHCVDFYWLSRCLNRHNG